MTDKPVPSITALMRLSHAEFEALLFADASGGQGPPPDPTPERHGRDEQTIAAGGQGPLSLDDHAAAHDASMDGRQGRHESDGQSDAATGSFTSDSISDSRQGRPASDDHAVAAMGDPQQDSDAGVRQGRTEGTPADATAEAAAGQGPAKVDGAVVDVQDEGIDVVETVGGREEPTAPASTGDAPDPEVKTPAAVVVDPSFAALAGPDAVPSVVRGAARRLWMMQVVMPADAPVGGTEEVPSAPSADAATGAIATADGIPDDRQGRLADDAPVLDNTVGRQGRLDIPPSVDGQGPETSTEPDPRQGRDEGMDSRQGRPTDGDHPTAEPAEDGTVVDRPAGPAMEANAEAASAVEPAGPAEAVDPAAGPPAAEEMGPAGPAEGGQESGDPTAPVDGAAAAEPKREIDSKSARQLRLLREAADEIAEDLAKAARQAERAVEERAEKNKKRSECVEATTYLTRSSGSEPELYAAAFKNYATLYGIAITPAVDADLAVIHEPPREQDGQMDAAIEAAQREVDLSERDLAAALAEVEAAMAAEAEQRSDRSTDERIMVEIDAADRESMAAVLSLSGRPIPTALVTSGPITDASAAAIRHELLLAEQGVMRRIAEMDAQDDVVDPRVHAAIDGVRRLVDGVHAGTEARLADIDAILTRDGWCAIGAWLRDEAERISDAPGFPDPDGLSIEDAERVPERHAADPRPEKPMWHRRITRRTRRWTVNSPMRHRVNEHIRVAEETKP